MRIWRWGRKWPHHHRFVCICACVYGSGLCVCRSHPWSQPSPLTAKGTNCSLFLSDGRLYSTITSEHWKKQATVNNEPKDFRKSMRWSRKGEKNIVEGWVVVRFWGVEGGAGGSEAKNKTGDEERKWKEMSAKIVMRHHNHTGWDEKGKLEQRRIEKETQTGRGVWKDRERKWEDRKRE